MRRVLVDTSVWIDHFRASDPRLVALLENTQVLGHPWVRGEVGLGTLAHREAVLTTMDDLPRAVAASAEEVMTMVEHHQLFGRGIGWVDAQLLAATLLTDRARLWSKDRRLRQVATEFGVAFP